ncbi:MAG: class II aldolase/adducin family protein [Acidobacteria bacterium]|nr:class II aldolase/adducin family protein [Acidobacteriota bacterium]
MKELDLREVKVVTGSDVGQAVREGAEAIRVQERAIITPSAREMIESARLKVIEGGEAAAAGSSSGAYAAAGTPVFGAPSPVTRQYSSPQELFRSPEATAIKEEIIRVGRKLWERQYVDGNGGNITYRITDDYVISTPTMCSKGDLTLEDFSLVDMEGRQVAGERPRSSEVLLHLEIFKAVPEARAGLHCHPPHATAYAITGSVPPRCVIPEHEVFIGTVVLTPYETPGTKAFAETVVPYARKHNTILLANHGVICWADTVTHAEWLAEVVDTYCRTLILAGHLGAPLSHIPEGKTADLLEMKKKLGLPDARFGLKECQLCDQPEFPSGIACPVEGSSAAAQALSQEELENVIRAITDQVMDKLEEK